MTKLGVPSDYTGREIKEGDQVAYPVRSGSSMWLTDMIVEKIVVADNNSFLCPFKLLGTNTRGNRCILKNLGRCVVLDRKAK